MYACIYNIFIWRGLMALLILEEGQCEGLRTGMGEKLESPMPFLFPLCFVSYQDRCGRVGLGDVCADD